MMTAMSGEKTMSQYPLADHADEVRAQSGRPLEEITLEAMRQGCLSIADLSIDAETLRRQADIAEEAGFGHLAGNLRRAAELTKVPNDEIMTIYEALRPYRTTYDRLIGLAQKLERDYDAHENARFVREAARVYRERGLV